MNETKRKTQLVVDVLEDIALLIGEFKTKSVKLSTGITVVPGLGMLTDEIALRRRVQDIRQGLFTILVLGNFNNGKSTLINALLGKKAVGVRAIPTTAVVTVISYGKNPDVAIYEHGHSKPCYISWEKFQNEYCLTNDDLDSKVRDRFAHIDYTQIETQQPFVSRGIKLVDSPGLGEDAPRTTTTLRFLKQAQAVLLLLDANHLLDLDERQFIHEYLGQGRLEHVFFVINRINEVEAGELKSLNERLQSILAQHFKDSQGNFDKAYYSKRVFLVDALTALRARTGKKIDQTALERAGLLALEKEIKHVLGSEERFRAVIMSSVQTLSGILTEAREQIMRRRIAMEQPLKELKIRQKEAEIRLQKLEEQRNQISEMLSNSGEKLYLKASRNYQGYVSKMEEKWASDSAKHLPLNDIELSDLLIGAFNEDAKQRVISVVQQEVTAYVQNKLKHWSEKLWKSLEKDVQKVEHDTLERMVDFQKHLNLTQNSFATGQDMMNLEVSRLNSNLSSGAFYISKITGNLSDLDNMLEEMFAGLLLVLGVLIFAMFSPLLLVSAIIAAMAGASFTNSFQVTENFKEKIREKIGADIHATLKADTKVEELIHRRLRSHFNQFAENVGALLDSHIHDARHQMQSVIDELENKDFSVASEMARLDKISEQLEELFNILGVVVLGRQYHLEELKKVKSEEML